MSDELDRLAACWTVLARLLAAAPDAETLSRVRSADLLDDWPLGSSPQVTAGADLLRASAAAGETAEQIRADHDRLLWGPGRVLVAPYESVHRSVDRLLFDAETLQVRQAYAEWGLAAPQLNREPDDHIALELEFLATLVLRALDATETGDPAEAERCLAAHDRFLAEHLGRWAPDFFAQLHDAAGTDFHRGLALLGSDALERWEELRRPSADRA